MTDAMDGRRESELLWEPTADLIENGNITRYMSWLKGETGRSFANYDQLWQWSIEDTEGFWRSLWDYFQVKTRTPFRHVVEPSPNGDRVEGARWFTGATLNYAEHALSRRDGHSAIVFGHESGTLRTLSYAELWEMTARAAAGMRKLGVRRGDSVVAFIPNVPEAVAAMLATASIGATWSSCPPEFGVGSVIDRFLQLEPKVLLATDGYTYNGKPFDSLDAVAAIQQELPTLKGTVLLPYLDQDVGVGTLKAAALWRDFLVDGEELTFEPVPFDHPLWVLYSSGTTGSPKAIVHGHGGILIEHIKALTLHSNISEDDRFFWFTTTGWMMWNYLVSGLLVGATIVLYDGSPAYPDMNALWSFAARTKITWAGVSAAFIQGCMKSGVEPGRALDLTSLRVLGSTGAPLPPEGFAWVYGQLSSRVLLASISGGTDVCTAFIQSSTLLPLYSGEMQCRALGCKVESFDEEGTSSIGEVGELVITNPMPSMPVRFLGDSNGQRLHDSYFNVYPDVWHHGDWLKITPRGTCIIYGRSDSTLNRSGIRMGTSEFYRVVEDLPDILDSLVIDTSQLGTEGKLLLFVVVGEGIALDDPLRKRLASAIRTGLSPRHVPDEIIDIPEVPRTLNGKKLEVPVKKILGGLPLEKAVSLDALANREALQPFIDLGGKTT